MQTVVVYEDPTYDEPKAFLYQRDIITEENAKEGEVISLPYPQAKFPCYFLVRSVEFHKTFDAFGLANRLTVRPVSTLL